MKVTPEKVLEIIRSSGNSDIDSKELIVDKLLAEQGIDSLDIMSLILNLEEAFGVKIPDEEIDKGVSIDSLVTYLNSQLQSSASGLFHIPVK
jgi:acyl carrier protein